MYVCICMYVEIPTLITSSYRQTGRLPTDAGEKICGLVQS